MTIIWISPDIDTWRVQREGHHRAEAICGGREEAIERACGLAVEFRPCLVRVQDYGGTVTQEIRFGLRSPVAA